MGSYAAWIANKNGNLEKENVRLRAENEAMATAFVKWWASEMDEAELFNSMPASVRQKAVDAADAALAANGE